MAKPDPHGSGTKGKGFGGGFGWAPVCAWAEKETQRAGLAEERWNGLVRLRLGPSKERKWWAGSWLSHAQGNGSEPGWLHARNERKERAGKKEMGCGNGWADLRMDAGQRRRFSPRT